MPELPEVETVVRTLEKQLGQPIITNIEIRHANIIGNVDCDTFISTLKNEQIMAYHRLGKYLIFECRNHYLIAHMRMEGKFYIQQPSEPCDKHIHVIFQLADGRQWRYHDTRKFGKMYIYDKQVDYSTLPVFAHVGYDAFDERVSAKTLYTQSRTKSVSVKQFLLDQRYIAGIGNIYADEICFSIGIHPASKVSNLSKKDFENIVFHTRRILQGAINAGGTTIRSYTSSLKVDGRFQLQLKVHDRKGEACVVCGNTIEKIQLAGRGTSFCKTCQKRK